MTDSAGYGCVTEQKKWTKKLEKCKSLAQHFLKHGIEKLDALE